MKGTRFIGYLLLFAYVGYHVGKKIGHFEGVMELHDVIQEQIKERYGRKEGQE